MTTEIEGTLPMLTKKSRLVLFLLLIAILIGFAVQPYLQQYREQIHYGLRSATGQWGDGSTRFVDVAPQAGLHYRWTIPGPRPMDILQTIGNGCAFLDYDNDGNLDILLVEPNLALYKGDGHGHFTDVTHQMGLDQLHGHFLGCAVGDYDNDGFDDIYISGYRTGLLLHNDGGKRFTDVTRKAGLAPQPWGTSCTWGDYDRDGRLDLYVGNYVVYDPAKDPRLCPVPGGQAACPPSAYKAAYGVLYRNLGGGRFQDVTRASGASHVSGKALGDAFVDDQGTGFPILAVANDDLPGDLLLNIRGHFQNAGESSGTAYTDGVDHAGMGVDWGDYDNDGLPDLFVGTFALEPKPIYHNRGRHIFEETSGPLGFRDRPVHYLTFGAKWLDYDNDGWLDLIFANGHVRDNVASYRSEATFLQPTLLFHNENGRHLTDESETAGPSLAKPIMGRGLALGDFDNDGKMDVLIVDSQGAPLLLHNESRVSGHWLSLKLIGTKSNRDSIGAAVTVTAGALKLRRFCHADGSYLSSSDLRVHVGLGNNATASEVLVQWPSGLSKRLQNVPADQQITVREGS